jgi:hypothetical protein
VCGGQGARQPERVGERRNHRCERMSDHGCR